MGKNSQKNFGGVSRGKLIKSMIIGIDGNEANIKNKVGVNQYAYELLKNMHKLQEEWPKTTKVIVYLKKRPRQDLPKPTANWQYRVIPGRGKWILTKLMPKLFLEKEKPDVFFTPSHYLPPLAPVPMVCTIHDLGYLKFSGQFKKYDFWQLKLWTAISVFVSKRIIAVSNRTMSDIVRHYPFASRKIRVVHHGYDKDRFNTKISENDVRRVKKRYSIVNDYVLFIGTLKPSKNLEGLIEAFSLVKGRYPDLKLVVAGKKGWLYKGIFQKAKELGLEKEIIFTGFVEENDKPALIRGAKVFVLPSFWEGFGMDVINSLACGTPVVVSKVASLPEVAGSAGIFVDPYDAPDIARGLEKVLSMNEIEYNRLVEKGVRQAKEFSWEKAAKETLEVLKRAAR